MKDNSTLGHRTGQIVDTPANIATLTLSMRHLFASLIGTGVMIGTMAAVPRAHAAPKKVLRIQAVKVQGQLQKPQAFYILQRSSLNFEGMDSKQSFVPRIIQSVDDKPF